MLTASALGSAQAPLAHQPPRAGGAPHLSAAAEGGVHRDRPHAGTTGGRVEE